MAELNLSLVAAITNDEKQTSAYWRYIWALRLSQRQGFVNQKDIEWEEHCNFMAQHYKNYRICLLDSVIPVGFIGMVGDDIRLAVDEKFQGQGIGAYMIEEFSRTYKGKALVRANNKASRRAFEKSGYKVKYYIMEKDV